MLEFLLASSSVERIIVFLDLHEKSYASELARAFGSGLDPVQKALKKLEEGGLLVSFLEGRTRVYTWNPRNPFVAPTRQLARTLFEYLEPGEQDSIYLAHRRKRPRKQGKPL